MLSWNLDNVNTFLDIQINMAPAVAVSLPQDGPQGTYQCHVDCASALFSITWSGTTTCPDISAFPESRDIKYQVSPIHQTPEMALLWQDSTPVTYGAFAHIRRCNNQQFPMLKLAHHANDDALAVIQHEYRVLCDMQQVDPALPIPHTSPWPICDRGVVVGYRMQELHRLPFQLTRFPRLLAQVERAVERLHDAGFAHGDLSPSNVMQDGHGRVVLIDFGHGGRLGEAVPPCIPYWVYPSDNITNNPDVARLKRIRHGW